MIARELIIDHVPPIKPFEPMEKALLWMDEFRVSHLPVVDKNKYYGLVSESMIYDCNEPNLAVSELDKQDITWDTGSVDNARFN